MHFATTAIASAITAAIALPIVAIDLAKSVFQLYYIGSDGKPVNRRISRAKLLTFFSNRERSLVAMETCAGAHYWARQLTALGHEVRLLPAQHVKAFVQGDKTDAKDAQAIYVAAGQPHIYPVPVKSVYQQSLLVLHNQRDGLLKERIAHGNRLRGHLLEFGIALPEGANKLLRALPAALAQAGDNDAMPAWLIEFMQRCARHIAYLNEEIAHIERTLADICRQDPFMRALLKIPGIGVLTATALVASVDIHSYASARQFASSLGLAPRQTGTGGKTRQLGLSKRGNPHLRRLLIHGARSVLTRCPHRCRWLMELMQRRPRNVAVAAMANKLARTAWAVLVRGKAFEASKWNPCEGTAAAA